jgi:hypothetical protein
MIAPTELVVKPLDIGRSAPERTIACGYAKSISSSRMPMGSLSCSLVDRPNVLAKMTGHLSDVAGLTDDVRS